MNLSKRFKITPRVHEHLNVKLNPTFVNICSRHSYSIRGMRTQVVDSKDNVNSVHILVYSRILRRLGRIIENNLYNI